MVEPGSDDDDASRYRTLSSIVYYGVVSSSTVCTSAPLRRLALSCTPSLHPRTHSHPPIHTTGLRAASAMENTEPNDDGSGDDDPPFADSKRHPLTPFYTRYPVNPSTYPDTGPPAFSPPLPWRPPSPTKTAAATTTHPTPPHSHPHPQSPPIQIHTHISSTATPTPAHSQPGHRPASRFAAAAAEPTQSNEEDGSGDDDPADPADAEEVKAAGAKTGDAMEDEEEEDAPTEVPSISV